MKDPQHVGLSTTEEAERYRVYGQVLDADGASTPYFRLVQFTTGTQSLEIAKIVDRAPLTLVPMPAPSWSQEFTMSNHAEVSEFVAQNPVLDVVLSESKAQIQTVFGDVEVRLALTEVEVGQPKELWVLIQTALTPSDALDAIDRLDNEWWCNVSRDVRRLMAVDVEFKG